MVDGTRSFGLHGRSGFESRAEVDWDRGNFLSPPGPAAVHSCPFYDENCPRVLGRPRHLGAALLDQGALRQCRDDRLLRQCRPGGGIEGPRQEGQEDRRLEDLHRRPPGGVRPGFHLSHPSGRGDLRGTVLPRHQHRPSADRQAHGGNRPAGRGGCHRPRRHGQGQRPGPLRTDRGGPRPGPGDHRPLARRPLPQRLPGPPADDRLLRRQGNPRPGERQEAVLDGPQPPAHLLRGRHPGGPVVRQLRPEEPGVLHHPFRAARGCAGQGRVCDPWISSGAIASR